ncbi:sugar phosphate nucleotidyltransferase [Natrialbaceae archaeon AArc-T1-2]|uniref:sugar phosphate nucleotidyltransferase n=1 Tax=Natrialbaceae archaeon AArc-T1-2 TaxID=3053904 RepID=UPI00255B38EF|nr:sugar phosphate nucleotidyltransferase [Natrialbaceae archaeon AArc-T1-2]WIV68854.1 sugar phosphate nucleotidyltransferase [Natrialbaceae archaeon AArc-T1-2]
MEIRSAVVLAAGEGSRLRPLTRHRPKPMLPAATKPILEHVFDELIEAGVTDITVVVGYRRNRVQSHFGPTYRNVPITYVTQEKQLGSGHALLAAEEEVDGSVLVVNGDQLVDRQIIDDVATATDGADATLGLVQNDVEEYGGVILADGGEVTDIVEKPRDERSYRLNAGVYAFETSIFDAIRSASPCAGEQSLVDGIRELIDGDGEVHGVVSEGLWVDATYPWDLLRVADDLLAHESRVASQVSPSARIHDAATIVEPVVIERDCVVGPGAVVGPNVCLGENVTVGSNTVVEHSVVDADTRVGDNATLRDCVTGRGVTVGPGTTVVGGPGDVRIGDQVHQDEQLGAVLADRVHDEGGSTYAPGTIVGPEAVVRTGSAVRGTVDAETEVRS